VKLLKDLPEWVAPFFTEEFPYDEEAVNKRLKGADVGKSASDYLKALSDAFLHVSSWNAGSLESALKETATNLNVKTGELVHPARVAVSGRGVGPGLYEMLEILGSERVLNRFAAARAKATE